jgi:hypothetical protein
MNRLNLIAIAAAGMLAAATASAQEATPDTWISEASSTLTPAEARANALAALAAERSQRGGIELTFASEVPSTRSRADVVAELLRARESGEFQLINAEAPAFGLPLQGSSAYALRRGQ